MNTVAAACLVMYYVMVTSIGVWAARKYHTEPFHLGRRRKEKPPLDYVVRLLLANREMTVALGAASLIATWMGAGIMRHLATEMFARGLLSCYAPIAYSISFVIGGSLFANKIHQTESTTILDPLQRRFGQRLVIVYFIPCLCAEVMWSAVSLTTLGYAVNVIIEMNERVCIILSSIVTLFYTSLGGLYAVVYTDLFQAVVLFSAMLLCIPFCLNNASYRGLQQGSGWIGTIHPDELYHRIDRFITIGLGGISLQDYTQRILSSPTPAVAEAISYAAAFGCIVMAVPAIIVGGCAKNANFTSNNSNVTLSLEDVVRGDVLALAIRTLTPGPIAAIAVLGLASSVMATVDSAIFSAATMLTRNIYKEILRPQASVTEVVLVLRLSVIILGAFSSFIALGTTVVHPMWNYASDLVFILVFPQVVCTLYLPDDVNAYGSLIGFFLGLLLRTVAGEPGMGLPTLIRFPSYDEKLSRQRFPLRTFSMVAHLACMLVASRAAKKLFVAGTLPRSLDVLHCFDPERRRSIITFGGSKVSALSGKPGRDESDEKRKTSIALTEKAELLPDGAEQEQSVKSCRSAQSEAHSALSVKSGTQSARGGRSRRQSVADVLTPLQQKDQTGTEKTSVRMGEGTEIHVRVDRSEIDTSVAEQPKGQTQIAASDTKTPTKRKGKKVDKSKEEKEKSKAGKGKEKEDKEKGKEGKEKTKESKKNEEKDGGKKDKEHKDTNKNKKKT
ncbi:high-affinity choline transporter 1-like [Ornithodoros turicata]|uniref:high-affinity choline transporter 1-like n=1 Tax=Ornithodoros turicata TaxID=34597 RepID=UPI003139766D